MELPTDLLRTFVAASDTENFTATASIVHRTQSAVSLQMKRLEELVGSPLFERIGHTMRLTQEGRTLVWYARRILKLNDEALMAVTRPELKGRVRLGAPDDYAERLLPSVLARFAASYPHVEVDVSCEAGGQLLIALNEGRLDLLVRTNSEVAERGETIFHERVVWITSPKHLAHEQDPLPLALYYDGCIFRDWALKSLVGSNVSFRIAYTSPGSAAILAAVRAGLAVAPVARSTVPDDLRILGPEDGFPELPAAVITIIKAGDPQPPTVQTLADHIVESFREMNIVETVS